MVLVLWWVDNDLNAHEEFTGLYEAPTIQAAHLVLDTLIRLNLSISKIRGQCYDGASNMAGIRKGVAKQIQNQEPTCKALFTHCYGHSLNLATNDAIKKCKTIKNALDITHEITKLVKYSPRRESLFHHIKGQLAPDTPGVRVLCPTRWTVRADSMESTMKNYTVLYELWKQAAAIVHDTETIARIRGVASQMLSFDFFFGLVLGELLLCHADNLSKTLQKNCSASEGQRVAAMTKKLYRRSGQSRVLISFGIRLILWPQILMLVSLHFPGGGRCQNGLRMEKCTSRVSINTQRSLQTNLL